MKHIFLFNENSRAAVYGIGTYIRQLAECFKDRKDVRLHIIELQSGKKEMEIIELADCCTYYFPSTQLSCNKLPIYYRNVWYILKIRMCQLETSNLIFHLNYFQEYPLIKLIKNDYPNSKTIFTIHYFDWCFMLKGNSGYFKRIIHTEKELITDNKEMVVFKSYEEEKRLFREVDHVICLSEYAKNLLLENYAISDKKISLIYNGLKDEYVQLSQEEKRNINNQLFFEEHNKIILFVGRLDEIKGVDVLIEAFKEVVKKDPDTYLIIVGDGDYSTYLKKSAEFWKKIIFTGRLEKDMLYKLYQIVDLGVMPSFHEQCSYVAIEMMMFDIPLIISTTTGLNEMLSDQESHIEIIEKDDSVFISPDLLSQKILYKLENTSNKKRTINRNRYIAEYTLQKMCDSINFSI